MKGQVPHLQPLQRSEHDYRDLGLPLRRGLRSHDSTSSQSSFIPERSEQLIAPHVAPDARGLAAGFLGRLPHQADLHRPEEWGVGLPEDRGTASHGFAPPPPPLVFSGSCEPGRQPLPAAVDQLDTSGQGSRHGSDSARSQSSR